MLYQLIREAGFGSIRGERQGTEAQAYPNVRQAFVTQYIAPYTAEDGSGISWWSNNTVNPKARPAGRAFLFQSLLFHSGIKYNRF
ncbi:MAG: hypothetical protein IK080_08645 [Clostridia bacterium]|nr:hypothetical protein [Clostridia bacterium]